MIRETWSTWW